MKYRKILTVVLAVIMFFGYMAVERHQIEYPLDSTSTRAVADVVEKTNVTNVGDSFWQRNRYFSTTFESLSGYGIVGPVTLGTQGGLVLKPTLVATPAQVFNNVLPFDVSKPMFFRMQVFFASGTLSNSAGTITMGINTHFGFSFNNTTLFGLSSDVNGNTVVKTIDTLADASTGTGTYLLEARYYPNNRVVFFVDGSEQGSLATVRSDSVVLASNSLAIDFETTTSSVKEMDINTFEFMLKQ